MVSPRWRKVVRDLSHNKTRTLLVVLSIAIGVFAVGMILHTAILVIDEVESDMALARTAHATIYAEDLDDDMLLAIANIDGVVEADGRSSITVRIKISGEGEEDANGARSRAHHARFDRDQDRPRRARRQPGRLSQRQGRTRRLAAGRA